MKTPSRDHSVRDGNDRGIWVVIYIRDIWGFLTGVG